MTLLFYDGFGTRSNMMDRWDAQTLGGATLTTGPDGRRYARFGNGGSHRKNVTPANPIITGDRYLRTNVADSSPLVMDFLENGNDHVRIESTASGRLRVYRGGSGIGTVIATTAAAGLINNNVGHYIEYEVFVHGTNGYVKIWIHENLVLDTMNEIGPLNTRNGGAVGEVDQIEVFGQPGEAIYHGDIYVLDTTGSAPWNARLGECEALPLAVIGAGSSADWTSDTAAANWENVDDSPGPDDDATTNSSDTPGDIDLHQLATLSTVYDTWFAVQVLNRFRKEEAGIRQVRGKINDGSAIGDGPTVSASTGYLTDAAIFQTRPAGAMWSNANPPTEAGIETVT